MKFTNQQKFQILLSAAEERYKSIHLMRERVHKISVWAVGIFLVMVGWIGKQGADFSVILSTLITVAVLGALVSICLYIRDIEKGFKNNFWILTKVESLLGLYKSDFFDNSENSLYPKEWSKVENRPGKFFKYSYLIVFLGACIVIAEVWLIRICAISPIF